MRIDAGRKQVHLLDVGADELRRERVTALVQRRRRRNTSAAPARGPCRTRRSFVGLGVRGAAREQQRRATISGAHTQISSTATKPSRSASRSEAWLPSSAPHTGSRPAARSSRIIADGDDRREAELACAGQRIDADVELACDCATAHTRTTLARHRHTHATRCRACAPTTARSASAAGSGASRGQRHRAVEIGQLVGLERVEDRARAAGRGASAWFSSSSVCCGYARPAPRAPRIRVADDDDQPRRIVAERVARRRARRASASGRAAMPCASTQRGDHPAARSLLESVEIADRGASRRRSSSR